METIASFSSVPFGLPSSVFVSFLFTSFFVPEGIFPLGIGFDDLAAALAAATLAAAADGLTAVVEVTALLAVDDAGLFVAELLDLLIPELAFEDVEAGLDGVLTGPLVVVDCLLVEGLLLVVADDDVFATPGRGGRALEVELALDGCLDTVGVGLGLVTGGRTVVEEVGRFGSTLVSGALFSVGLGLDGLVLGTGGLVDGFVVPFSVGLVASGFLSAALDTCTAGLVGRLD